MSVVPGSWENRYQKNLLDQEGEFYMKGKHRRIDGSDSQLLGVSQTCLLLVCLIRTQHSWCTLSTTMVMNILQTTARSIATSSLEQLPLKNKDLILCSFYIMGSIVHNNKV